MNAVLQASIGAGLPAAPEGDPLAELLRAVAAGDERALAALYRRASRAIYAFALRRVADPGIAEDVVAETMYEVWKCAKRFKGESRATTWILGIARHKALDRLRERSGEAQTGLLGEEAEGLASDEAGAFEAIARREDAERTRQAIAKLPAEQRECVHLVFYQDLGLADIARIQGVPENTVKTRLFHARRKLRAWLCG